MSPLVETMTATGLAILGVFLGRWFSRRLNPWWVLGYVISLAVLLLLVAGRASIYWELTPPISWIMEGRNEFILLAVITPLLLTTPMCRLKQRRPQVLVGIFMGLATVHASIYPLLSPALNQRQLASLVTRIDRNGICLQTTDYTCGPAAAVTALRRLDLKAEEKDLAILARTCSATGTQPDELCRVLNRTYGAQGLQCEYRGFASLEELKQAGLVIAIVKYALLVDHYVAVLEVTEREVVVGDPSVGRVRMTPEEFREQWRKTGITLRRIR